MSVMDDIHITYSYDGPHSITIDGNDHTMEEWRVIIASAADLRWFVALALLFGIVIGAALVLAFV